MKVKYIDKVSLVVNAVTFNFGDIKEISESVYTAFKPVFELVEPTTVATKQKPKTDKIDKQIEV
jgi:hypothetical protein